MNIHPKWGCGFGTSIGYKVMPSLKKICSIHQKLLANKFWIKGILHQDYQSYGPNLNVQDTVAIGTYCTKGCQGCVSNFKRHEAL